MDQDSVDRIRSATFNNSRRGYDRGEVDSFLQGLADWLDEGGAEPTPSEVAQRELDQVGRHTAGVLTAAGEAAAEIRGDAEADATDSLEQARIEANAMRVEADDYADRVRAEAEEYSEAERGKADAYATEQREVAEAVLQRASAEAEAEAEAIVAEGQTRRDALETVISDLVGRRDKLLDELEGLAGSIAGTASRVRGESVAAVPANGGPDQVQPEDGTTVIEQSTDRTPTE